LRTHRRERRESHSLELQKFSVLSLRNNME
jgi:hypothetical protein